jgi:excinuclease ABC subunit B
MFDLRAPFKPSGHQPEAIDRITNNILNQTSDQVLLGVTGCGKTYVMANVIKNTERSALVLCHNKTLAAQTYQELKEFFPNNAVEYFVSYYDYYQPESYIPSTDTYIEKDADINEQIDKLRLSATTSLMTRKDVIVVASVSCIYNLGSPTEYTNFAIELRKGMKIRKTDLLKRLSQLQYLRNEFDFKRGTYRVTGDVIDVFPAYLDYAIRLEIFDQTLVDAFLFNPLTGEQIHYESLPRVRQGSSSRANSQDPDDYTTHAIIAGDIINIFPAKHYIAAEDRREGAIKQIEEDLEKRLKTFKDIGKEIEAYRIKQRTEYDLEMLREIGYCKGIENYSRYFDGRNPGDTPYSLMDFFPKDYLLVVDESHIMLPQVRGMYNGDQARKSTLIDYGFRLPSALDNRPLNFDEFLGKTNQTVYMSATPGDWEMERSHETIVELLTRPTGIVDPEITIIPSKHQILDLYDRIVERTDRGERVLVTTLTKRMAEELASFLLEKGVKVTYLHSDIVTLERTNILDDLRRGTYDVLVGINLLREGLDLPEVSLVAILDADKEGFLRSDRALIQTMGRAARHILGEVIMYADHITGSMQRAIDEVGRRRDIQLKHNEAQGIVPTPIVKGIREKLIDEEIEDSVSGGRKGGRKGSKGKGEVDYSQLPPDEVEKAVKKLEKLMKYEAEMLNFEEAAALRDRVRDIRKKYLA